MTSNTLTSSSMVRTEDDFDSIFHGHYGEVYRLAYRIVGNGPEAEDIAQETFLRLYHHRFPPGREHNRRAWLFKVATNLAYNSIRSRQRRVVRQRQSGSGAPTQDPEEELLRQDEQETVRRALGMLSPQQQHLLLCRHAGLSYRELATNLDIAPGSVGTLLARAHSAFHTAYSQITRSDGEESHAR